MWGCGVLYLRVFVGFFFPAQVQTQAQCSSQPQHTAQALVQSSGPGAQRKPHPPPWESSPAEPRPAPLPSPLTLSPPIPFCLWHVAACLGRWPRRPAEPSRACRPAPGRGSSQQSGSEPPGPQSPIAGFPAQALQLPSWQPWGSTPVHVRTHTQGCHLNHPFPT